jgi:hypothetical protein
LLVSMHERCDNMSSLSPRAARLQPVEQAEVPVAYPQNNLIATAVAVGPAAGGATPAVATVVDTTAAPQGGAAPPVAVATVVPSTGFQ